MGFALNGSVKTHNIREYCPRAEQPLDFEYVRNDDRHKLTVWVGLMGNGTIIGLFFFRQSINGEDFWAQDGALHIEDEWSQIV